MSETAHGRRDSRLPALAGAVALHIAVLALVIFVPHGPPPAPGSAVPINVVSNAPATDTRPAEQAPQTQTAQAPQPTPEAPP
ncbi:MAG: energy transducer TonB, partial [Caulobacteraceae bacterium]